MRLRIRVFLWVSAACAFLCPPAQAQWAPGGVPAFQPQGFAGNPLVVANPQSSFITWADLRHRSATDSDVWLQRLTALGVIAPGWPTGGLSICSLQGYQQPLGAVSDESGGVITGWIDSRSASDTSIDLYVQRVLADGSIAPGWIANGVAVTHASNDQLEPTMASDGAGGVFMAWTDHRSDATNGTDIYAQHVLADGSIAPGWPADGLPVCVEPTEQSTPSIIADGTGGIVVAWSDGRYGPSTCFAQHVLADGSIAPGWAVNGNTISPIGRAMFGIVPDGAGGFYMANAVLHPTYPGYSDIYVGRMTFADAAAPGWTLSGLKVCGAPSFRGPPSIASDGSGGVFLSWYDYRYPYDAVFAARVLASGTLAAGWTTDGTLVTQPGTPWLTYENVGSGALVADGFGGVYVAYIQSDTTGTPALIQHLLGNGAVAPGWQAYGDRVATRDEDGDAFMGADGQGGVVVAWSEGTCCGRFGVWAQRFALDGPVPVELSLVSAEVKDGIVALDWFAPNAAGLAATVQRRTTASYWVSLGTPSVDGSGHIRYQDRSALAGTRYGYRLAYSDGGAESFTPETWVDVPAPKLALNGLRPNPAVGAMAVSFSLADAGPASLEVVDVSGRRVAAREVGSLGAGSHFVQLAETSALKPGIYWFRLRQGDRTLLTRGAIVR